MSHYNPDALDRLLHCGNHDTFAWLSSISAIAGLVPQHADNLTDEQRTWLHIIHTNAQQCRRLSLTKMSAITNITADIFYTPPERIALADIVADVIAALNANVQYGGRPIVIEVHADAALPSIQANRRRLHSCLHTIMTEFQDTTPSNPGHIHLTAQPRAIEIIMHPFKIVNTDHSEMLSILLADNGGEDISWDEETLHVLLRSEPGVC
jgi:hypothetical protein